MSTSGEEDQNSKEFQSLGSIALKRVKRSSDGSLEEAEESRRAAAAEKKSGGAGSGFSNDVWDQMEGQGGASDSFIQAGPMHDIGELRVDDTTVLIGAPPLGSTQLPPDVTRAIASGAGGFLSLLSYGLKAPRVAQAQRDTLNFIGIEVAKMKKKEQELLAAMGKAARLHDITPKECSHLVDASQDEEMSSLEHRLKADEVLQARNSADEAYKNQRAQAENKLAGLEKQEADMVAQAKQAEQQFKEAEKRLEQLRRRESELRNQSAKPTSDEEAGQRVKEYESIKAQRKVAEMELETLQEKARSARRPIGRIRDEITAVRQEASTAKNKLNVAVSQARAAKVTGQRREEYMNRTVAEIDEEIGRTILDGAGRLPELRQLIVSTEVCRRRVSHWESVLADQQTELERFDEKRARLGFWILISILIGGLTILLGGGEIIRRMFLSFES